MNEKIMEKLKDAKFLEKIIVMSDEKDVKEAFKKEGLEITDEDLKDVRDHIEVTVEAISRIPEEELEEISGGYGRGLVDRISDWLSGSPENKGTFVYDHSDQIVEAGLATALIAGAVGGTIGVQKLIQVGKKKGWWTKQHWKDCISKIKSSH